jgi:alpha-amylase
MQPRLYLGLVLHNHQPVGNYGFVFDELYRTAYEPMLAALERHRGVRAAVHNSGPLWDWILANQPDYVKRLRLLCDQGQVEMVGGGYYEPVLSMISDDDKAGQIGKMRRFIEERFGRSPSGLWLTERVWEPSLPAPLERAGVGWTLVDDAHFRMAGMRDIDGYYVTEDQGCRVHIFAGSQRLRYTIPWLDVEDLIAELRTYAASSTSDAPYLVLGDDGEKFGGWPTTFEHVWAGGWIERFFSALERETDWLETITPGAYREQFPARGLIYLPAASYSEMMEWALPSQARAAYHETVTSLERDGRHDVLPWVRGGFWRGFLAKYPEANAMHKRGVRIDRKLQATPDATARESLWAAQCNCPYWHGLFGGLYLRHIRSATLANLVRAERQADATAGRGVALATEDIDFDGRDEIIAQTPEVSLVVHPALGGMISEFDLRRRDRALLDVIARRFEAYHHALVEGQAGETSGDLTNIHGGVRVKRAGLEQGLVFDRHRRSGMQEWLLAPEATLEQYASNTASTYLEPDGMWAAVATQATETIVIQQSREHYGWRLAKQLIVGPGERLRVEYTITNGSADHRAARLISEWNLNAPLDDEGDGRINELCTGGAIVDVAAAPGAIDNAARFSIRGSAPFALECTVEPEADLWRFPIETVSSSEGGLERVYQGACIGLTWLIDMAPGEVRDFAIEWSVAA